MTKYQKWRIDSLYQDLLIWQDAHRDYIFQFQLKIKNNDIKDSIEGLLQQRYLRLYYARKSKCDLCNQDNGYKFIRIKEFNKVKSDTLGSIFVLCDKCYFRDQKEMALKVKHEDYKPMTVYMDQIQQSRQSINHLNDQKCSFQNYQILQILIQHNKGQIKKHFDKNIDKIFQKLYNQVEIIKKHSHESPYLELFHLLKNQHICKCNNNCCFCENMLMQGQQRSNCEYFNAKVNKNNFIKEIDILFASHKLNKNIEKVMLEISKRLDLIVIQQSLAFEQSIQKFIKRSQNVSLRNSKFLKQIDQKIELQKQNEPREQYFQKLVNDQKYKSLKQGVINHLTHTDIKLISNEITTINIDYCKDVEALKQKLLQMSQLKTLKFNNYYTCKRYMEDQSKVERKIIENQLHQQRQSQILIPEEQKIFDQLQFLEFNCKIPLTSNFFTKLDKFNKLRSLCLNWNLNDSFQKFIQSSQSHFRQDKIMINAKAPPLSNFVHIYKSGKIKFLWLGQCQNSTLQLKCQNSLHIIQQKINHAQGLMLGQLDGVQKQISKGLMAIFIKTRHIKVLVLNKTAFQEKFLNYFLKNNQSLQAILFNQCQSVSKETMQIINQLPYLKKLSFVQTRIPNFQTPFESLETFFLQNCYSDVSSSLNCSISLSKLKNLSLYECLYIDEKVINNLLESQTQRALLESINLGNTNISNHTLSILNKFDKLKNLHIGGTKINLFLFMKQLQDQKYKNLSKILKLSLKEMKEIQNNGYKIDEPQVVCEYYNNIFARILFNFPLLSHLDISHNYVIDERSIRYGLKNLVYLTVAKNKFNCKKNKDQTLHKPICPFKKLKTLPSNCISLQTSTKLEMRMSKSNEYQHLKIIYQQ